MRTGFDAGDNQQPCGILKLPLDLLQQIICDIDDWEPTIEFMLTCQTIHAAYQTCSGIASPFLDRIRYQWCMPYVVYDHALRYRPTESTRLRRLFFYWVRDPYKVLPQRWNGLDVTCMCMTLRHLNDLCDSIYDRTKVQNVKTPLYIKNRQLLRACYRLEMMRYSSDTPPMDRVFYREDDYDRLPRCTSSQCWVNLQIHCLLYQALNSELACKMERMRYGDKLTESQKNFVRVMDKEDRVIRAGLVTANEFLDARTAAQGLGILERIDPKKGIGLHGVTSVCLRHRDGPPDDENTIWDRFEPGLHDAKRPQAGVPKVDWPAGRHFGQRQRDNRVPGSCAL